MTSWSRLVRRGLVPVVLAAVCALLFASPASAHAELVSSTPANGQRLASPPAEITMTFTESVNLLDGGIRLLDRAGATVPTPNPTVDGHSLTWRMPADLPGGAYVVSWRVVSSDGHPVSGAFSFGIGAAAVDVPSAVAGPLISGQTAPWPVVTIRLVGYLAFALFAGVVAFVLWCSPGNRTDPSLQRMVRAGLVAGMVAAVAGLLVQGPYTAGTSMSRLMDPRLLQQTLGTPFGTAMMWRLAAFAALAVLAWRLAELTTGPRRWLVPAGVVGAAVTIAAAGHGGASGRPIDLVVVTLHVLTAGIWVGGLVVLVVLGRAVERRALLQFSVLAMVSVLTLVTTGVLNSLREVRDIDQLWLTRYGLTLDAKVALVALALTAAAVSRRRVQQQRVPLRSVRVEACVTVGVLAVTALLSMTTPPPRGPAPADPPVAGDSPGESAKVNGVVQMSLGDRGTAFLAIIPATTAGSRLRVLLTDPGGQPLEATRLDMTVSNPGRDLGAIPVRLTEHNGFWVGRCRFPLPGLWKATLTLHDRSPSAVVTGADFVVTR